MNKLAVSEYAARQVQTVAALFRAEGRGQVVTVSIDTDDVLAVKVFIRSRKSASFLRPETGIVRFKFENVVIIPVIACPVRVFPAQPIRGGENEKDGGKNQNGDPRDDSADCFFTRRFTDRSRAVRALRRAAGGTEGGAVGELFSAFLTKHILFPFPIIPSDTSGMRMY